MPSAGTGNNTIIWWQNVNNGEKGSYIHSKTQKEVWKKTFARVITLWYNIQYYVRMPRQGTIKNRPTCLWESTSDNRWLANWRGGWCETFEDVGRTLVSDALKLMLHRLAQPRIVEYSNHLTKRYEDYRGILRSKIERCHQQRGDGKSLYFLKCHLHTTTKKQRTKHWTLQSTTICAKHIRLGIWNSYKPGSA